MTADTLPLAELMQKAGGDDFLRAVAEAVVQLLMEADVDGVIGAGRHERSGERTTYRNGFRDRALDTRLGTLQLRIPKLRSGPAYFPPFLEPRRACRSSRSNPVIGASPVVPCRAPECRPPRASTRPGVPPGRPTTQSAARRWRCA